MFSVEQGATVCPTIIFGIFAKIPFFGAISSVRMVGLKKLPPGTATGKHGNSPRLFHFQQEVPPMKKRTRRTILFLESLENRVVPSNTQALLEADHGAADAPAMVAELETPRVENDARAVGVSQATGASETAKVATIWDGLSSSVSDASNLSN